MFVHGYRDINGKIVVAPEYEWVSDFGAERLAKVRKNGLYGFIDEFGTEVVKPAYRNVNSFSEDLAAVQVGIKWGYVNKSDSIVIPAIYDFTMLFYNGLALVRTGNKTIPLVPSWDGRPIWCGIGPPRKEKGGQREYFVRNIKRKPGDFVPFVLPMNQS